MDKKEALENALKQIEKDFGKGSIMRLGDATKNLNVEVIPTGILPLDEALGVGGLPRGRIIEVYGPESSGKTTVTLHMIAEAQRRGGLAAFIDAQDLPNAILATLAATNAAVTLLINAPHVRQFSIMEFMASTPPVNSFMWLLPISSSMML